MGQHNTMAATHTQSSIDSLRTACEKAMLPGFDDATLEKFLAARKGDVPRAMELIKGQVAWKKDKFGMGHLEKPTTADVQPTAKGGFMACPGVRDKNGCLVLFIRPARLDLSRFTGIDIVKLLWYVLDKACDDPITREKGFTVCEDLTGIDMSFFASAFPSVPKEVMGGLVGAVPARLRGAYIMNQPWAVGNALYMAQSTFMPAKLGSKIHICGEDTTKVHEVVSADQLPASFGGTQGELEVMVDRFLVDPAWFPPVVRPVQRRLSDQPGPFCRRDILQRAEAIKRACSLK